LTAVTSVTDIPKTDNQFMQMSRGLGVGMSSASIDGDVPMMAALRIGEISMDDDVDLGDIVIGAKAVDIDSTEFCPFVSLAYDDLNTVGTWESLSDGLDTSLEQDKIDFPMGKASKCDFGVATGMSTRVIATTKDQSVVNDYVGEYAVYVVAEQESGSAGDVELQLVVGLGSDTNSWDSPYRAMQYTDEPEVVYMGRVSLGEYKLLDAENLDDWLEIELLASSGNGSTPDLWISHVIFIPIDLWSTAISSSNANVEFNYLNPSYVEIDGGVIRDRVLFYDDERIKGEWLLRGSLPVMESNKQLTFYFLFHDDGAWRGYLGGLFSLYPVERWSFLRGSS
jgi:hypothetical protein